MPLCHLGGIKNFSNLFSKNDYLKCFNFSELNCFCYIKCKFADVALNQLECNLV